MSDDVPLTRADLDRENRHLRERIEIILEEREKALRVQALEYERRLEELNNAHERAELAVRLTVPRDKFDTHVSEIAKWQETVNDEFAALRGAASGSAKRFTVVTTIMFLVLSAITIWVMLKQNEKTAHTPVPAVASP